MKELVLIVQRLGACTGRMEEGALRVDANVSLRKIGEPLSTRTEVNYIILCQHFIYIVSFLFKFTLYKK